MCASLYGTPLSVSLFLYRSDCGESRCLSHDRTVSTTVWLRCCDFVCYVHYIGTSLAPPGVAHASCMRSVDRGELDAKFFSTRREDPFQPHPTITRFSAPSDVLYQKRQSAWWECFVVLFALGASLSKPATHPNRSVAPELRNTVQSDWRRDFVMSRSPRLIQHLARCFDELIAC